MRTQFTLKVTLLTILLCLSINAKAAAVDHLSQLLSNFWAMTADFEQTLYDDNGKPLQKSTGEMALKRPGHFRWEILTPTPQIVVTNGKYLWVYDVDLEQATQQAANTNDTNSPASLLSGSVDLIKERFKVAYVKTTTGDQRFKLAPKDDSDLFEWIDLSFVNGKLTTMHLSDKMGTYSIFEFSDVRINPPLNNRLFTFKTPKGVELIKN